ncbi:MAG: hypothetical protein QXN68_03995 [Thermoplasmata archaeon]
MKYLTIEGKQKTSINELKNELLQLMNYEPEISTNGSNFKCFIIVYLEDDYNTFDVIRILVKHCSNFKVVVDEEVEYESFLSVYYYWDGKNLIRCYKDYFGSSCENVNFLLD